MAWELYARHGIRTRSHIPMIALYKGGSIRANACLMKSVSDYKKFAVLLFDKENRRIGIRFCKEEGAGNYCLSRARSGGSISGKAFVRRFNILPSQTQSYPAIYDEKEQLWYVQLAEDSPSVAQPKEPSDG